MAVGTFGGQGLPLENGTFGCWDKWRLGHLAARADPLENGPIGCWDKWRLGHLAVRADPYNMGQMAVGTFGGQDILLLCF